MIEWLLKELEKNPTGVFRKRDLLEQSKEQFKELKSLGLLIYVQPNLNCETYPCSLPCANSCPMDVVEMDSRLYAICPQDSEIDPISLNRDELDKYQFCIEKFLELVRSANKLAGSLHEIEQDYFYFGYSTYKNNRVGFVFGFTITCKSTLELTGLKRFCADDDYLVIFSPVLAIEDISRIKELGNERIIQTSFASSLNFQTFQFSIDKLVSGILERRAKDELERLLGKAIEAGVTKWEEISVEIIDEHTVRYKIGANSWKKANYADLGFIDRRKGLPDQLWPMFKEMAKNCSCGYITIRTLSNVSKDMDRIRSTLRVFFGINEIPIKYNKKALAYQVKFHFADKRNPS